MASRNAAIGVDGEGRRAIACCAGKKWKQICAAAVINPFRSRDKISSRAAASIQRAFRCFMILSFGAEGASHSMDSYERARAFYVFANGIVCVYVCARSLARS